MNAAPEGREDTDAPIAKFIATALDDDGAIVGDECGCDPLVCKKAQQIFSRCRIKIMLTRKPTESGVARSCLQFANQLPNATPELQWTARCVAMPERHLAGLSRCGRDKHAVVSDFVDSPGGGAENKRVSGATLEDHLLIQLAHADGLRVGAREEDSIQSSIRNCSAIQYRETLRTLARRDCIAVAIPGDAGAQFGKFIGWIAAREQIEYAIERCAAERSEGSGAADETEQFVDSYLSCVVTVGLVLAS